MGLLVAVPARAQYSLEGKPRITNDEIATEPPAVIDESVFTNAPDSGALSILLAGLEPGRRLRITKYSREVLVGLPRVVRGDTLWLMADSLAVIALPDVARVQQWRSGSEQGAKFGAISVGIVGGLLGVFVGGLAAAFNDSHDSDVLPMIIGPLGGIAVGAMAGSLIGAGLGATTRSWYTIWPAEWHEPPPPPEPELPRPEARLLLEAGRSASTDDAYDVSGAGLAIGLFRRQSAQVELGPAVRYQALSAIVDVPPRVGSGTYTQLEPIATISFDVRWQPAAPGLRPCVDGGLGYSLSNDLYPSAHLGVGLRARDAHERDYGVMFRRHAAVGRPDEGVDGYWTVAASFAFSL